MPLGLADQGDRLLLQQMKTRDGHLVLRTVLTTYFLFHATDSFGLCAVAYPIHPFMSLRLRQNRRKQLLLKA